MSDQRDIKLVLDDWLGEGASHAPDRIIDQVLGEVARTPQSRTFVAGRFVQRFAGVAAAAVLVLAVASALIFAFAQLNRSNGPAASPSPSPSPSSLGADFEPAISLEGLDGWQLVQPPGGSVAGTAVRELVLQSPAGTKVVVMSPNQAIETDGTIIPAPAFIDSWLWTRGGLTFIRTQPALDVPPVITVDQIDGRDMEGFVDPNAKANENGAVVLLCAPDQECNADTTEQLAVHPADHFRIVVLVVRGKSVVIATSSTQALWDSTESDFIHVLDGIRFDRF